MTETPRDLLEGFFRAALEAALPDRAIAARLPEPPKGRVVVVGAGKASAAMAAAFETAWATRHGTPPEGLVVVPYGHGAPTRRIRVAQAGHPVPDDAGAAAAEAIAAIAAGLGADDLMVALISGGGSSLLVSPVAGVSHDEKRALSAALLRSGASIGEINAVRKPLSRLKGGRLAALAAPARVVTYLVSDVPGDDPAVIASGPTIAAAASKAEARRILERYGIETPASVVRALAGDDDEIEAPQGEVHLVATPIASLRAAAETARAAGVAPLILGDAIEGEAREVGRAMAGIARSAKAHGLPLPAPCVILSGGETAVTLRRPEAETGRGGRNVEFLLGLVDALDGAPDIHALAADTDGIDGGAPIAGAFAGPETRARAEAAGASLHGALARHDGHGFFEALGDHFVTGPTRTNVNDFRAILIR